MGNRIYGAWAGNPKGIEEDEARCIKEVWEQGSAIHVTSFRVGILAYQCSRKRGHGFQGLYCKLHAKTNERRLYG